MGEQSDPLFAKEQRGRNFEIFTIGYSAVDFPVIIMARQRDFRFQDARAEVYSRVLEGFNPAEGWIPDYRPHLGVRKFFLAVRSALRSDIQKHLRIYPAVGTSADYRFGTDCIFKVGERFASIDVTTFDEKVDCRGIRHIIVKPNDISFPKNLIPVRNLSEKELVQLVSDFASQADFREVAQKVVEKLVMPIHYSTRSKGKKPRNSYHIGGYEYMGRRLKTSLRKIIEEGQS